MGRGRGIANGSLRVCGTSWEGARRGTTDHRDTLWDGRGSRLGRGVRFGPFRICSLFQGIETHKGGMGAAFFGGAEGLGGKEEEVREAY